MMSPSYSVTIRHSAFRIPPLHIAHITRCISSNGNAYPRATVRLSKRWDEFQGANNWDGLLDPLNPILRAEILRYGSFVQAAYTSCDLDPSSSSYATCRFQKDSLLRLSGIPSSGYRVTRKLYATSTSRLTRLAAVAGLSCLSCQSSYIGFVAVCHDDVELSRLGRRDVAISLRGTVTLLEWLDILCVNLTPSCCPTRDPALHEPIPKVECGFWSLFNSPGTDHRCLRDQIREEVHNLLDRYGSGPEISITITGHSLGAALAVLAANDVKARLGRTGPMVTVISFGGPRVGNESFARRMEEQGSRVLRIVNTNDIITKVPGLVDGPVKPLNLLLSMTGWVYADIGRELRVSSRRTANMVACHDLKHYLQLVESA